jgi:GNAT superfamily N-acetyltransferase
LRSQAVSNGYWWLNNLPRSADTLILGRREIATKSPAAELYSIYVTPERWRHGVGSRLLIQSSKMLGDAGFASCTLWVLAQNGNARRFYERHGWRSDGTERSVDGPISEVRYRKEELLRR